MASPTAYLNARWNRLRGKEGAIRLLEDEKGEANGEEGELPFFLSGEEAEREGYTSAHLLFECVLASLWNASCLVYLTSTSLSSGIRPSRTFILGLLALITVPLFIGVSAGAAALWRGTGVDVVRRKEAGTVKKVLTWVAFVACVAAAYPILFYLVEGQNPLLQAHLTVTIALIQVVLVKAGCDKLSDSDGDLSKDSLALPADSAPLPSCADEKTLLTAREVLLEQHFSTASAKAKRVLGIDVEDKAKMQEREQAIVEVKVEVVPEEREGGSLLSHSFAV
ncbi:hypothetical protein JCM11251_006514 [Rhodosporidiobolus azoricus]